MPVFSSSTWFQELEIAHGRGLDPLYEGVEVLGQVGQMQTDGRLLDPGAEQLAHDADPTRS